MLAKSVGVLCYVFSMKVRLGAYCSFEKISEVIIMFYIVSPVHVFVDEAIPHGCPLNIIYGCFAIYKP